MVTTSCRKSSWVQSSSTESRSSERKLKPLPPDPFRHQDSAIALVMQSPSVPPVPAQAEPAPVIASAHPPLFASPVDAPLVPASIPSPQLDREQIAILVERGKHLIAS